MVAAEYLGSSVLAPLEPFPVPEYARPVLIAVGTNYGNSYYIFGVRIQQLDPPPADLKMDPPGPNLGRNLDSRSIFASGFRPMGVYIHYQIWTPLADLGPCFITVSLCTLIIVSKRFKL